jgi:hypothetical protein
MADNDKLKLLIDKIPDLDKRGTVHGPPWSDVEPSFDIILAGQPDSLFALVGMLQEVDDGTDWKVRYILHGIAIYLGREDKSKQRALYTSALALQLKGKHPAPVKRFVLQQLRTVGGPEVLDAVGANLTSEDLHAEAANALLAIGGSGEQFRKALPSAKGKPRLSIVQALGVLADKESAPALRAAATDADPAIAQAAGWGLANIGDAPSVDIILKRATETKGFERTKAVQHCLLLAERLIAAGDKKSAKRIYTALESDQQEGYVRDLAKEALAGV